MSDIQKEAQRLIDAGWSVVPLVHGQKRATDSWQKKTYAAIDFNHADDNIAGKCGEPSGWRVDIDSDAVEAVRAACLLLPTTGLVHGRPGKPDSHHWYRSVGSKSQQFEDVKDASGKHQTLIEIRSTGGYTMLPPSIHPSGDRLAWTTEQPPLDIPADDLWSAVRNVALAALLARHWPGPGARHHFVGHLAGFLAAAKLPDFLVVEIIRVAATVARDPDVPDRVSFAQGTLAKRQTGAPTTGGPKLADAIGADVVQRMRGWLKLEDTDALEAMNARHFVVRMGKDTVIGREDDPDSIVFQKPRDLQVEYANREVSVATNKKGDPVVKPVFEVWLKWPGRRSYNKVVFAPPPQKARLGEYNLWKGFAVEPDRDAWLQHKCQHLMAHIRQVICADDPVQYEYLMNLLARTVQHPGEPLGISIVMRGEQGSGKGLFVDFVGALFHPHHYSHLTKMDQAIGRFNKAVMGKIVIFLDEAAADEAARNHGTFKSLITDKQIQIELKGVDTDSVDNLSHIFLATNNERSVPASEGDRRFFFLRVSDRYAYGRCAAAERKAYFDPLFTELDDPAARAAFLYCLQERSLTDFDRFDKVVTTEEREQQRLSLRGPMRWLMDVVASGNLPWSASGEILVSSVYRYYVLWAQDHDETPIGEAPWGKAVNQYLWLDTRNTKQGGRDVRLGHARSLDELIDHLPPVFAIEGAATAATTNAGLPFEVPKV